MMVAQPRLINRDHRRQVGPPFNVATHPINRDGATGFNSAQTGGPRRVVDTVEDVEATEGGGAGARPPAPQVILHIVPHRCRSPQAW